MNNQNTRPTKVLIAGAMDTELQPLLDMFDVIKTHKLLNTFPLSSVVYNSIEIFIVKTFVGDVNASIAGFAAIEKTNPDYVVKLGAVGGSYSESKAGDIVVPLGFFHRTGWITKDKNSNTPTADASRWDSVFGEKDYQIQESRHNLGGMPYYFPVPKLLQNVCEETLQKLERKYVTAYVGGGNMWMSSKEVLDNVASTMLPSSSTHRRFVSDMESYSLAHACYILKKPFLGCYVVASNDYLDEEYNPSIVSDQMSHLVQYVLDLASNLTKNI